MGNAARKYVRLIARMWPPVPAARIVVGRPALISINTSAGTERFLFRALDALPLAFKIMSQSCQAAATASRTSPAVVESRRTSSAGTSLKAGGCPSEPVAEDRA